jgi:hypothetical protein
MEWFPHPLYLYIIFLDHSYDVDGQMDPQSCHFNYNVGEEFRELAEFLDHSEVAHDVKVGWLRPQTHMEWFPHLPYVHIMILDHSYAVDGQMDPPSCHFNYTCWRRDSGVGRVPGSQQSWK